MSFVSALAADQSIHLSWAPNSESNIAGYVVHYGTESGNYANSLDVGNVTSGIVSNLAEGVTYYFMVTAYNTWGLESTPSAETVYVSPIVVPPGGPPLAGTMSATVNSSSSATLNGAVNPNGAATRVWFEYGRDTSYGWSTDPIDLGSGSSTVWVNSSVNGLLPASSFHFRVVAANSLGTRAGVDVMFTTPAIPPTVTTLSASAVAAKEAVLNAAINPNGRLTTAWFQWGFDNNYGYNTPVVTLGAGYDPLSLAAALTNLQPGRTFHFRAVATNVTGLTVGGDASFTTSLIAPSVWTLPASVVGSRAATFNGRVNPNGRATLAWFIYGLDSSYGFYSGLLDLGDGLNEVDARNEVADLQPGTTYHFRLVASSDGGNTYGADQTFTTAPRPSGPSLILSWPPNPESNIAGYRVYLGVASRVYTNAVDVGNVTYCVVTGLVEGVTYYFAVAACNTWGLQGELSPEVIWTAPFMSPPALMSISAKAVSPTSATLSATVVPSGTPTTAWFEYGLDDAYGQNTSVTNLGNGMNLIPLQGPVTGLLPAMTYHYRIVASNEWGVVSGTDSTFTTPAAPAMAVTLPADQVGPNSAMLHAALNPNGTLTLARFEYGLGTNYGLASIMTNMGTGYNLLPMRLPIGGLLPGATYHFRVMAGNRAGVVRGQDMLFTTPAAAPDLTVPPASAVDSSSALLSGSVNPNGADTRVYFDYGLDTTYGLIAGPVDLAAGNGNNYVSLVVADLLPATTYHFRMVAMNKFGTVVSAPLNFTTLAH